MDGRFNHLKWFLLQHIQRIHLPDCSFPPTILFGSTRLIPLFFQDVNKHVFVFLFFLSFIPGSRHLSGEQHGAQLSYCLVALGLETIQGHGWRREVPHPDTQNEITEYAGFKIISSPTCMVSLLDGNHPTQ